MNKQFLTITSILLGFLLSTPGYAEVVNNTHWQVQAGDTVYSIARRLFPDDTKKQAQFRREFIKQNSEIFRGNANQLIIGSQLKLPDIAVAAQSRSDNQPVKSPDIIRPEARTITVSEQPVIVTPDPEETIGRVIVSTGDMEAVNRGSIRKLSRNSAIYKGDTLRTHADSRSQIRLKDGALIALNPDTDFLVEDYQFNGSEDGNERSVFNLIRGGFRTITGLIGHTNKNNYQVKTSVATIGIRGTHYGLTLCAAGSCMAQGLRDGLYGGIVDGSITTNNQSGEFRFSNDQYFHIESMSSMPRKLLQPPKVVVGNLPRPMQEQHEDDEQRNLHAGQHRPRPVGPPLQDLLGDKPPLPPKPPEFLPGFSAPDGSGFLYAFNGPNNGVFTGSAITAAIRPDVIRVIPYDNNGVIQPLPVFVFEPVAVPSSLTRHIGFNAADPSNLPLSDYGQLTSIGSVASAPARVNWGRWDAAASHIFEGPNDQPIASSGFMHYIFSPDLTPVTRLAELTATSSLYAAVNGTRPSDNLGNSATSYANLNLDVNFSTRVVTSYSVNTNILGVEYSGSANDIPFTALGRGFTISDVTTGCTPSCAGQANLNFIGPNAEGAISSFTITNFGAGRTASGVVVAEDGG